jgi:hypothetical protein
MHSALVKTLKQNKEVSDAYVISDVIEIGSERKIPLWMVGLLSRVSVH